MALGKTHDKVNLFFGSIFAGLLIGIEQSWPVVLSMVCGWLLATLVFSPDTDLMPKKRARFLRFFLYPYSLLFRHRGISHSLFLGTLTRIVYGIATFGMLVFILNKMGYIKLSADNFFKGLWIYFRNYDYSIESYKMVSWFFGGMFIADFCHVMLDKISDMFTRFKRIFR